LQQRSFHLLAQDDSIYIASLPPVLEGVLAVAGMMASWITLRAALIGFIVLLRGGTPREVAEAAGYGAAVAVPGAALIGVAAGLYLLLGGP
jgi:hypothetical protein